MRTIIAGSRGFENYEQLDNLMHSLSNSWKVTEVLSGGARGADYIGEVWASAHNIPVQKFPAEWDKHGKGAGFIRNTEMAENAEALIAIWDGKSRGTKHMVEIARRKGLIVVLYNYLTKTTSIEQI